MSLVSESDVVFANPGGLELLGRIYRFDDTIGHGIVMVHGGAWTANDRKTPHVLSRLLAMRGLVVFSLDFRCGPAFQHPTASADIAAGIRYFRHNADTFSIDANTIGIVGSSSGGHLVLFTALQPNKAMHRITRFEPESTEDIDASVAYVVALWPVSNPLVRYEYALDQNRTELVTAHQGYFGSREAMHHASVQRVLRNHEYTHLPPVFVVQPGEDMNVPQYMTNDLKVAFRGVNHEIDYLLMPNLPHAFAYEASEATDRCEAAVWEFIRNQLP